MSLSSWCQGPKLDINKPVPIWYIRVRQYLYMNLYFSCYRDLYGYTAKTIRSNWIAEERCNCFKYFQSSSLIGQFPLWVPAFTDRKIHEYDRSFLAHHIPKPFRCVAWGDPGSGGSRSRPFPENRYLCRARQDKHPQASGDRIPRLYPSLDGLDLSSGIHF